MERTGAGGRAPHGQARSSPAQPGPLGLGSLRLGPLRLGSMERVPGPLGALRGHDPDAFHRTWPADLRPTEPATGLPRGPLRLQHLNRTVTAVHTIEIIRHSGREAFTAGSVRRTRHNRPLEPLGNRAVHRRMSTSQERPASGQRRAIRLLGKAIPRNLERVRTQPGQGDRGKRPGVTRMMRTTARKGRKFDYSAGVLRKESGPRGVIAPRLPSQQKHQPRGYTCRSMSN